MSRAMALKRARALVAAGWASSAAHPFADGARRNGSSCSSTDEGIASFTVNGAVTACTRGESEFAEVLGELERQHAPRLFELDAYQHQMPRASECTAAQLERFRALRRAAELANETYLDAWLMRPERRLAEVLRLFDLAILRATAREAA